MRLKLTKGRNCWTLCISSFPSRQTTRRGRLGALSYGPILVVYSDRTAMMIQLIVNYAGYIATLTCSKLIYAAIDWPTSYGSLPKPQLGVFPAGTVSKKTEILPLWFICTGTRLSFRNGRFSTIPCEIRLVLLASLDGGLTTFCDTFPFLCLPGRTTFK